MNIFLEYLYSKYFVDWHILHSKNLIYENIFSLSTYWYYHSTERDSFNCVNDRAFIAYVLFIFQFY